MRRLAMLLGVMSLFLQVQCAAACVLAAPAKPKAPCHSGHGSTSLRVVCPDALAADVSPSWLPASGGDWHPAVADGSRSRFSIERLPEALPNARPPAGPAPPSAPLRI